MHTIVRCLLPLALIAACGQAQAEFDPAERARLIAPYIEEQTIAVAHVDVTRIKIDPLVGKVVSLVPEAEVDKDDMRAGLTMIQTTLRRARISDVYVVFSLVDIPREQPLFLIAPLAEDSDVDTLLKLLPNADPDTQVERLDDVLYMGPKDALERLKENQPSKRPELAAAFEAAGDTTAQFLLLPTDNERRVIEEMLPELPKEISGGPSTILTHGLLWAAVGLDAPPNMSLRLVIQSRNGEAATAFRDKLILGTRLLGQVKELQASLRKLDEAVKMLIPEVEGDRLTLMLSEQNGGITALLDALTPPLEEARSHARRSRSCNNLKQIAIAMHNYHDTFKSFPAQANYDASGKPLLSWRVHVLPFVDKQQLYEQFHLDEPWDSEHNRKLIEKMPDVYRSPASKLKEKGRTSYLFPVGEQTVCPGPRGIKLKEITDGTSYTILVVEVADDHAVIWTKPDDLPFDPENPAKGLGGLYEGGFNAAYSDGSVHFLQMPDGDQAKETLGARFTRAGREVIPRD